MAREAKVWLRLAACIYGCTQVSPSIRTWLQPCQNNVPLVRTMETAASIIAVLQLSGFIITYARTAHGARDDRERLCNRLEGCSHVLQLLEEDLNDPNADPTWAVSIRKLESVNNPLHRLAKALEPVNKELSKPDNIHVRLRWPFKKAQILELMTTIDREMDFLFLTLQNDSGRLIHSLHARSQEISHQIDKLAQSIRDSAQANVEHYQELAQGISEIQTTQHTVTVALDRLQKETTRKEADLQREGILQWLTPSKQLFQNQESRTSHVGRANWVVHSEAYMTWSKLHGQTLFCPGLPGAGKTYVTSVIAQDLQLNNESTRHAQVATLYCSYGYQKEQTLENLLISLLKQLVDQMRQLPEAVIGLYKRHREGRDKFILQEVVDTMRAVIGSFPRVFILINALDECPVTQQLMTTMFSLQESCSVNLLATSRCVPSIEVLFECLPYLEIRATMEDVRLYLQEQMPYLPNFVVNDTGLQEQIIFGIVASVDGMYVSFLIYITPL